MLCLVYQMFQLVVTINIIFTLLLLAIDRC